MERPVPLRIPECSYPIEIWGPLFLLEPTIARTAKTTQLNQKEPSRDTKTARVRNFSIDAGEETPVPHKAAVNSKCSAIHACLRTPMALPSASLRTTSSTESMSSAPSDLLNGSGGGGERSERTPSKHPLCSRARTVYSHRRRGELRARPQCSDLSESEERVCTHVCIY